jgi:GNAT superfamily N-acetyltransferase
MAPFIVLALPRSRTAWLARFLSYGDWLCGHDELMHIRTLDEIATWFTQLNIGTVETCAAPFWRLMPKDARIVTVRRPVDDVLASLAAQGVGSETVASMIRACDRKLDQIERRVPGVVSVRFDDLALESTCAAVFEHCLQLPHDPAWWRIWDRHNVSGDLKRQVRYCHAFLPQLLKLARAARQRMLADMNRPAVPPDGFTIQEEHIEDWFRDAKPLIREHMIATGQDVDDYKLKNEPMLRLLGQKGFMQVMTARSNGRLFGYLMTVLGPSLDAVDRMEALHLPFFVSKDCPGGLGLKLQRAALERLREKGVSDLFARAGNRGSGPRLGVLYRRLGFEEFSTLHRIDLTAKA